MPDQLLCLRMLVRASDVTAATATAQVAQKKLSRTTANGQTTVQRYTQSPGHFEIVYVATPTHRIEHPDFQELTRTFGRGWTQPVETKGTRSAIWNPSPSAKFFDPAVIWANLELAD